MMKSFAVDWDSVPEEANFCAIDLDGELWAYSHKPYFNTSSKDWMFDEDLHDEEECWYLTNVGEGYNHHILYERPSEFSKELEEPSKQVTEAKEEVSAASILEAGLGHMKDRAATYDAEGGERSMAKTVECFNALTGRDLTETEGWLMMVCLKLARANQGGFRMDSFEDGAAYIALMGESAALQQED